MLDAGASDEIEQRFLARFRALARNKDMPRLHICSLARLTETVRTTGARSLVTLLNVETLVSTARRNRSERHLYIRIGDITEPLEAISCRPRNMSSK